MKKGGNKRFDFLTEFLHFQRNKRREARPSRLLFCRDSYPRFSLFIITLEWRKPFLI